MTTYAELVTQIRDYAETDAQVLTTTIINDIIAHAEDRIFRNVELDNFKEYISGNTAANNRFVSLPGQTTSATTPTISDIATIRYVTIYVNSGTKERFELERVDADFLNEYYPTPEVGSTAKPRYYATWDMGTIAIAPTPNAVYKFEIGITKKPTGLGTGNTTTWVSVNAERALLYACMVETFKFLKAPQDQQVYEQAFQEALQELAQEQLGKKRRDEYRDGSLRIPIPSQNP
jgi:hypothetical protein|tara:strand:+ start:1919 stop:2617 length:699 start_codon:yes stop_codon:yes gene_type:complete